MSGRPLAHFGASGSGLRCSHGSDLDTRIPRPKQPKTALPPGLRKKMGLAPRREEDSSASDAIYKAGAGVLKPVGSAPDAASEPKLHSAFKRANSLCAAWSGGAPEHAVNVLAKFGGISRETQRLVTAQASASWSALASRLRAASSSRSRSAATLSSASA